MALAPHATSFLWLAAVAIGAHVSARARLRLTSKQAWMLAAAGGVLVVATVGPVDRIAEERSLSIHVGQHMLLFSAVPVLLLAGLRGVLDGRVAAPTLGQSATLLVGGVAVVWAFHLPPLMDATLRWPGVNDASHVLLLVAGLAMAWPLAAPRPLGGMTAVGYLAAAELAVGALGILLTWYPSVLFDLYATATPLWGADPKEDQMIAGAALLLIEEPLLAIEVAVLFVAALGESGAD